MEQYNILIVEDDKEIRDGIEIFLKSQNYNVFKAADGVEGLEVMEREKISLAIVDIMMPRMDGVTMTMKLREKYDFPVIMLSAKSEETDKVIGLNIGAETPEEIGVAIIAEIIEVKNKKKRTYGYSKEIRKAIENDTDYGQKVIATIIDRKGSAPQGVGVKMLICENGTCIGTIGGGCMEAGVVQKARLLMSKARTLTTTQPQSGKDETDTASICSVDLQNADAKLEDIKFMLQNDGEDYSKHLIGHNEVWWMRKLKDIINPQTKEIEQFLQHWRMSRI